MSDRALLRAAAPHDEDAEVSRAAFQAALRRAGWGRRRIAKALAEVDGKAPQALVVVRPRRSLVLRLDSFLDTYWTVVGVTALGVVSSTAGFAGVFLWVALKIGAAWLRANGVR